MGKGIIQVSFELLVQALSLPEGTEILEAREDGSLVGPITLELKVSHADLPPVVEGGQIPSYDPQFKSVLPATGAVLETQFVSWGDERR